MGNESFHHHLTESVDGKSRLLGIIRMTQMRSMFLTPNNQKVLLSSRGTYGSTFEHYLANVKWHLNDHNMSTKRASDYIPQ